MGTSYNTFRLTGGDIGRCPERGDEVTVFIGGDSLLELRDLDLGTGTGEAKEK